MTYHRGGYHISEAEKDRIEAQLAVAVMRAREMRGVPVDGYEPTTVGGLSREDRALLRRSVA